MHFTLPTFYFHTGGAAATIYSIFSHFQFVSGTSPFQGEPFTIPDVPILNLTRVTGCQTLLSKNV